MKFNKSIMYGAVVYSLFVGLICCSLAILGLLMRWCIYQNFTSFPFVYMTFLFYFRVGTCNSRLNWKKFNILTESEAVMPVETQAVKRTYVFLIIYLVLHLMLTVSALLAFCALKCFANRKCYRHLFVPLILSLIFIVVFDVVASVFYGIDFVNVMKNDGLMTILEIQNMDEMRSAVEQLPYTMRYVPTGIMFFIATKLFFFLVCNIVWSMTIVYINYSHPNGSNLKLSPDNSILANDNPAFEDDKSEVRSEVSDKKSEDRYNDTSRVKNFIFPHQINSKGKRKNSDQVSDDDKLDFKIQRPVLTASYYNNYARSKLDAAHDKDVENRFSRFHKSNGTIDNDENAPSLNFKEMKMRPTPPPKPNRLEIHARPTNSYYLNATGHENSPTQRPSSTMSDSRTDRSSGHVRTPQELRSQLPWSYFNSSDAAPRHALVHMDENEIPGTPLPDYDIAEPKRRHF